MVDVVAKQIAPYRIEELTNRLRWNGDILERATNVIVYRDGVWVEQRTEWWPVPQK